MIPGVAGSSPVDRPFSPPIYSYNLVDWPATRIIDEFEVNLTHAILLGILQGITEFIPVSSSGHLSLLERFLGLEPQDHVLFNVVLHSGTLLAIIIGLRRDIGILWRHHAWTFIMVGVATLPLAPLVVLAKHLKPLFGIPSVLGTSFLITGTLLVLTERKGEGKHHQPEMDSWWRALLIGVSQMLAVFPGLSRSGLTICSARWLGWSRKEAVVFSFLMAIPALTGAAIHEALSALSTSTPAATHEISLLIYSAGFTASFTVGLLCFRLIRLLAKRGGFALFGWYCMLVGALVYLTT